MWNGVEPMECIIKGVRGKGLTAERECNYIIQSERESEARDMSALESRARERKARISKRNSHAMYYSALALERGSERERGRGGKSA